MIKLSGSRFTASMPDHLKAQPEIQAIAYAVGRQIESLCAYADGARTYAAIQSMPERVLDLLAIELRTPAYDENYPIAVKRSLIEGTMLFYTQMGTPAAVERIIETIFGSGYISEWWEYGGRPYHFRAYTTNPEVSVSDVDTFQRVLKSVKRLSAWLDSVSTIRSSTMQLYTGFAVMEGRYMTVACEIPEELAAPYVTDESDCLLTDEAWIRLIDDEEENKSW